MIMFDRYNGGNDLMRVNFEQIGQDLIAAGLSRSSSWHADLAQDRDRGVRDAVAHHVERGRTKTRALTTSGCAADQPRHADAGQRPAGPRRLARQRQPDDAA